VTERIKKMSYFSVETDNLKRHVGTFGNLASNLSGYSRDISDVRDSLDSCMSSGAEGVKQALSAIIVNTNRHSVNVNTLGTTLNSIIAGYLSTEADIVGNTTAFSSGDNSKTSDPHEIDESSKDGSEAFDGKGQYGGDQMDIEKHTNVAPFHFLWWGKDNYLYDFIRKHPGYENLTDDEIKELLAKITDGGCGWIASANMIFAEFEGRPEDFEKIFGFPMYKDGDLNYDQLAIDFYLSEHSKFYIDDEAGNGMTALYASMYNYYKNNPAEFKNKYGIDMLGPDGKITNDAYKALIGERNDLIANSDGKCVVYENDPPGTSDVERTNRLEHYLGEKGLDFSYEEKNPSTTSTSDIQKALDEGKTVVIGIGEYNLYDTNGNPVKQNGGSHAVVVTGVTPEGDLIVSSWGEKCIYKPNEQTKKDGSPTTHSMYIYDIFPDK
jgi:hypothetical protein